MSDQWAAWADELVAENKKLRQAIKDAIDWFDCPDGHDSETVLTVLRTAIDHGTRQETA